MEVVTAGETLFRKIDLKSPTVFQFSISHLSKEPYSFTLRPTSIL